MHNFENNLNKSKKKKMVLRIVYIALTIIVIALIGAFDTNFKHMLEAIAKLNHQWIGAAFLCLVMFWLTDGILLHHIVGYMHRTQSFFKSLKVGLIGLYYGALTPFASGGQPMQVIYMSKDKMPVGIASAIVSLKFVVYELLICAFYVVAMLVRGNLFYTQYNQVFWLTTLGFVINLFAVVFIGLIMIKESLAIKMCNGLLNFLHKIKIIRKLEETKEKVMVAIREFHETASYIKMNKGKVLVSFLISVVNLAFLFAIPYFIYVAFGHSEHGLMDLLIMQSFLYLTVSFFPLPGAAGASEGGFYLFFSSIFTKVPVLLPMLIWRFISYYCVLISGSLFVVADEIRNIGKDNSSDQPPQQANNV